MKKISLLLLAVGALYYCKATEEMDDQNPHDKKPNLEELFLKFDTNKDSKLSKEEVEGPLKNDFERIDTSKDGFLTKEELSKKPEGNRPPPRNGGGKGGRR